MAIHKEGLRAALQTYRQLKTTCAQDYLFNERELNTAGYILLRDKAVEEAVSIFRLNTEEYPTSFNAFDNLAEAYVAKNDVQEAIRCYEQAVKLNPNYKEGLERLKGLRQRLPKQGQ